MDPPSAYRGRLVGGLNGLACMMLATHLYHGDQLVYDARRDKCLGEIGFRVMRFSASELDENLEAGIEAIAEALSR